jgi:hypothetical protein
MAARTGLTATTEPRRSYYLVLLRTLAGGHEPTTAKQRQVAQTPRCGWRRGGCAATRKQQTPPAASHGAAARPPPGSAAADARRPGRQRRPGPSCGPASGACARGRSAAAGPAGCKSRGSGSGAHDRDSDYRFGGFIGLANTPRQCAILGRLPSPFQSILSRSGSVSSQPRTKGFGRVARHVPGDGVAY